MHKILLYAAYGWLLLGGILHFSIDVVSRYLRGKRVPGPESTLYYGLNTSYALGHVLFAIVALLLVHGGVPFFGEWPGLMLGFAAAAAWLAIGFVFPRVPRTSNRRRDLRDPAGGCRGDDMTADNFLERTINETAEQDHSDHRRHERHRF